MKYIKNAFWLALLILIGMDDGIRLLAYAIAIAIALLTDYHIYLRGGDSVLFHDKNEMEKDLREIQKLEVKNKLRELRNQPKDNKHDK